LNNGKTEPYLLKKKKKRKKELTGKPNGTCILISCKFLAFPKNVFGTARTKDPDKGTVAHCAQPQVGCLV